MTNPKANRRVGAPSKLDAATKKTLLDEIRQGASYADAARVSGITPATVIGWRHRGERETEGEYFQFIEDLERARADRRRYYRDTVREHGKKDWRAIAWLAAVTEPEEFNPKVNIIIEQQFSEAVSRLKAEFAHDPDLLERVIGALVGENDRRATPTPSFEGRPQGGAQQENA